MNHDDGDAGVEAAHQRVEDDGHRVLESEAHFRLAGQSGNQLGLRSQLVAALCHVADGDPAQQRADAAAERRARGEPPNAVMADASDRNVSRRGDNQQGHRRGRSCQRAAQAPAVRAAEERERQHRERERAVSVVEQQPASADVDGMYEEPNGLGTAVADFSAANTTRATHTYMPSATRSSRRVSL